MEFSEYITREKLERDVLKGRPKLPKELEYSFQPNLAANNVNTYYYILAHSYGESSVSRINNWIVNNRLFFNKKDVESFYSNMVNYNLEFGNIYENKDYLSNKIRKMDINFNLLNFDHKSLYAMWLDEKTTKLTPDKYVAARNEYQNKIKSMLEIINKNLKEKRRDRDEKIDYLTYWELCYIISFCRYHPDIFFIYNAKNFEADYKIKDIQIFI